MMSVFAITLSSVNGIINEVYTRETTNIILAVIAGILSLFAAAFVFSARNKKILSWRLGWLAAAIICFASGWLSLPSVEKRHLLGKAVETGIQIDGVRRAYPNPSTKDERVWFWRMNLRPHWQIFVGNIGTKYEGLHQRRKVATDGLLHISQSESYVFYHQSLQAS